jgi:hypothetical protein
MLPAIAPDLASKTPIAAVNIDAKSVILTLYVRRTETA